MKWNWKEWAIAALIRAVRTFAQTFAGCIAVGAAVDEVQWLRALSVRLLNYWCQRRRAFYLQKLI